MEGFLIFRSLFNLIWFIVKWGLVPGVIAAVIAIPYLYRQVDEGVRREIQRKFAAHYVGMPVKVRSAARVEGKGIELRGFSIGTISNESSLGSQSKTESEEKPIFKAEEFFIHCNTDLADWIKQKNVCASRITLRRPTIRVVRAVDGSWSVARLLPLPSWSDTPPDVTIEGGVIEIVDQTKSPESCMTLRELNLSIVHRLDQKTGRLVPDLTGTATAEHLGLIRFKGNADLKSGRWSIDGNLESVDVSRHLCQALPGVSCEQLGQLNGFYANAKIDFAVRINKPDQPVQFEFKGLVREGRLDDPRLPFPLTKIRARFLATNDGVSVSSFFARGGQTDVSLSCNRAGYGDDSPWKVEANLTGLELGRQLADALPDKYQKVWRKYWPNGRVDIHTKFNSNGQTIDPAQLEATVTCRNVSFCYQKFPYRLSRALGEIRLKENMLTAKLSAYGTGTEPIQINAKIASPTDRPYGWARIEGHMIPLDRPLFEALDEKTAKVVRLFDPSGHVGAQLFLERKKPDDPLLKQFVIRLKNTSIRYKKFPYPIEQISGKIERFVDGSWNATELQGTNGGANIKAFGHMTGGPSGKRLTLTIEGTDVAVDNDLLESLPLSMRQAWSNLNPKGAINLRTDLHWPIDSKQFDLNVVIDPHIETSSIEPSAFPYRLERLQGRWTYNRGTGRVSCERFRAKHGQVSIVGSGYSEFSPDGSWQLHLSDLSVDRLRFDRELVQALPGKLRKALVELKPTGPMYLSRTSFDLAAHPDPRISTRAAWNTTIGFGQASLDCGVLLENMNGKMNFVGDFDGRNFRSQGELDIDSLTYKDVQFHKVLGPIWIDNDRALLGSWVSKLKLENKNSEGRPLTARLFGGTVKANTWVAFGQTPEYDFEADMLGADLATAAKTAMPGMRNLKGRAGAKIHLHGKGRTLNGLIGGGSIWLRDADIYELPVMISLLKTLRLKQPDKTAFSKADIDFGIKGNHIYVRKINFNGDAISLLGQGELDFQSRVNLGFHAVVGRGEMRLPLLSPLMGAASRQAMSVQITGTLKDPKTSRKVLPGVRQALDQLEAELESLPETIQR
jgi:AsmA-like C-terminal region